MSFVLSRQYMLVKIGLSLPFVKCLEFRDPFKIEMLYSVHGQLYLRLKSLSWIISKQSYPWKSTSLPNRSSWTLGPQSQHHRRIRSAAQSSRPQASGRRIFKSRKSESRCHGTSWSWFSAVWLSWQSGTNGLFRSYCRTFWLQFSAAGQYWTWKHGRLVL